MAAVDVAVVGGGILGLSLARALRRRGATVTIVEAGRCGAEASGAAAGILSLLAESLQTTAGAIWPLAKAALARHATLAEELRAETGVDPELDARGFLLLALGPTEEEGLSDALVNAARLGVRAAKVSGVEARRLEPALSEAVSAALHAPSDAQVDPRLLARALRESCAASGVEIREGQRVRSISRGTGGPELALDSGSLVASRVVVAAGAWSSHLGVPPLRESDVIPCRGQILVFKKEGFAPSGPLLFRPGHGYLVTRRDGRVLAGSTLEPGESERVVTAQGIASLARNAVVLLPAMVDAPLVDSWAGLRPLAKDALPVLGESDLPGVYLATGLHKSGILLGPVAADAMADLVEGRTAPAELAGLHPSRFRG